MRDLLIDVLRSIVGRPKQAIAASVGTAIAFAALIGAIGVSDSARGGVRASIDELSSNEVRVIPRTISAFSGQQVEGSALPADSVALLSGLQGVAFAESVTPLGDVDRLVSTTRGIAQLNDDRSAVLPVLGYDHSDRDAIPIAGRWFDAGHVSRGDQVAVLGDAAALALGIEAGTSDRWLYFDSEAVVVLGVLLPNDSLAAEVSNAVILPDAVIRRLNANASPSLVRISTADGYSNQVGAEVALALNPYDPDAFIVVVPTALAGLQARVGGELDAMFYILVGLLVAVSAVGIYNTARSRVTERTSEVGLRRALGATRSEVASKFLVESAVLGLVGAVIGSSLGAALVVVVAFVQGWSPTLDVSLLAATLPGGALLGAAGGIVPSLSASRIQPIDALRGV